MKNRKYYDPMQHIGMFRIRCNLCGNAFRAETRFARFCKTCRNEDEAFRFGDWLRA